MTTRVLRHPGSRIESSGSASRRGPTRFSGGVPEPPIVRPGAGRTPDGTDPAIRGDHRQPSRRPRRPVPDGPWERVLDLFERWRGDTRAGLAVLVAVAVVAGVVWYRIGVGAGDRPPPRRAGAPVTTRAPDTATAAEVTTTDADVIVVHVAGAVSTPGVVELHAGSRVIDAVEAAGGADDDADLDRLNLAAKLSDGERVLVQRVGDPPEPGSSASDEPASSSDSGTSTRLVNINTSTSAELEALPGIGPALAGAIIAERERRGRFRNIQELREVRGIGEKRFADLADLVTV